MKTKRNRVKALGPGSKLMLAGIAAAAIFSAVQPKTQPFRVTYEADSQGRVRRVERTSRPVEMAAPWKPDPSWLVKNAAKLELSRDQIDQIQVISGEWERRRAILMAKVGVLQARANRKEVHPSSTSLQESLAEYSELSRHFDQSRSQAWIRALGILTASQHRVLDRLTLEVRS